MSTGRRILNLNGVHIVKQIDGFHLPTGSPNSVHVDVQLEHVVDVSAGKLLALSAERVREWLGDSDRPHRQFVRMQIEAGKLPALDIGQILINGHIAGVLRGVQRRVVYRDPGAREPGQPGSPRSHLSGGIQKQPFDSGQFIVGKNDESNYWCFWCGGVEYVLPCMVVFKAFYSFSSQFLNAILGTPWKLALQTLVEPHPTRTDPQGAPIWPVKLLPGVHGNRATLHLLALFLHDPHALKCINSLHSDWAMRNNNTWWNTAEIPLDTTRDLSMTVHGHVLSQSARQSERFLITRIIASDWQPTVRAVIEQIRGEQGPSTEEVGDQDPTLKPPPPIRIQGSETATHVTGVDPGSGTDINYFAEPPFEFSHPPKIAVTLTTGSPSAPSSKPPARPHKPDDTVNSGVGASGKGRPGRAEIEQDHRPPSEHLEGLERALQRLRDAGVIDGCDEQGTDVGAPLFHARNGRRAWPLAGPNTGRGGTDAKVRATQKQAPWAWVWDADSPTIKQARALIVYKVQIDNWFGMLMDIERRPTNAGERFCMFLLEPLAELREEKMGACLAVLTKEHGVLNKNALLDKAFSSLGPSQPMRPPNRYAQKHFLLPASEEDQGSRRLDSQALGEWLLHKAQPHVQPMEWRSRLDRLRAMRV